MKTTFLMLALIFASPSFAANDACKPDVEKFCKGVEAGGGRIVDCLRKHKKELSPECQQAAEEKREEIRETFKKKRAEIKEACEEDSAKFCKGILGPRKKVSCLKEHETELSVACKNALPKR